MDHKWKMFVEVDGEDDAVCAIKEVQLSHKDELFVLTSPPYVMDKWKSSGDDNLPIIIECVVSYKSYVKKPKSTKHTHEVLVRENGSVFQKTVELTMKQSASIVGIPDDGYSSTTSPSVNSSRMSSRLASNSIKLDSVAVSGTDSQTSAITWANKVKVDAPPTFMPRLISVGGKEVINRNRQLAGSPMMFKQVSADTRTSASFLTTPSPGAQSDAERRRSCPSKISSADVNDPTLSQARTPTVDEVFSPAMDPFSSVLVGNGSPVAQFVSQTDATIAVKPDAVNEAEWTLVKSIRQMRTEQQSSRVGHVPSHRASRRGSGSNRGGSNHYQRSQSTQHHRRNADDKPHKTFYSEGATPRARGGRGRAYDRTARGRGDNNPF